MFFTTCATLLRHENGARDGGRNTDSNTRTGNCQRRGCRGGRVRDRWKFNCSSHSNPRYSVSTHECCELPIERTLRDAPRFESTFSSLENDKANKDTVESNHHYAVPTRDAPLKARKNKYKHGHT